MPGWQMEEDTSLESLPRVGGGRSQEVHPGAATNILYGLTQGSATPATDILCVSIRAL